MASAGTGRIIRDVLIVDISDFETRKDEIAKQLHYAASEVGFVRHPYLSTLHMAEERLSSSLSLDLQGAQACRKCGIVVDSPVTC